MRARFLRPAPVCMSAELGALKTEKQGAASPVPSKGLEEQRRKGGGKGTSASRPPRLRGPDVLALEAAVDCQPRAKQARGGVAGLFGASE